jgi:hypothetical protein
MLAEPVLRHLTVDRILGDLAAVVVVLVSNPSIPVTPSSSPFPAISTYERPSETPGQKTKILRLSLTSSTIDLYTHFDTSPAHL